MGALLWLGKPGTSPPTARKRLEEAPLVTKALREAQMKEKLQRYPKVQVGVCPWRQHRPAWPRVVREPVGPT